MVVDGGRRPTDASADFGSRCLAQRPERGVDRITGWRSEAFQLWEREFNRVHLFFLALRHQCQQFIRYFVRLLPLFRLQ